MKKLSKYERMLSWLKNHRLFSRILVILFILGALAPLKDIIFSPFVKKQEDHVKNSNQDIKINTNEAKGNNTITITMHDSSKIETIVGRDQTNNYLNDTIKSKKTIKSGK